MSADQLRRAASERSETWWFLSGFYLNRPDREYLEAIRHRMASLLEDDPDPLARSLAAMRNSVADEHPAHLAERLAMEFTRLFRGLQPGYGPPPPFESVYRQSASPGEATVAVLG